MNTTIKYMVHVLLLILCINIHAQKQKKDTINGTPVNLSEIIVTGDFKTDPVLHSVANTYVKKVLQPKNVADLFRNINGFSVIKRGNYAIDPTFRASSYERLNIQYDGGTKAMHACPNRMDPITTHIIPEEIAKIEIIKGPYSVRYGATFGGIINMVTQRPSLDQLGLHGRMSMGYESNGESYLGMLQLQHIGKILDFTGNFGYKNFGNYKDGSDLEIPSTFKSTDYGIRLGYNISNTQRLQTHWRQSFGRDVIHAGLPMDTEYDNSTIVSLDYKATSLGAKQHRLTAKVYYSLVDHLMTNALRPNFKMVDAKSNVKSTTIGGKIEFKHKTSEKLDVYTGIDLFYIGREGNRNRLIKIMMGNPLPTPKEFVDKIWQDAAITDVGLFSEAKWFVNPKTIFTAGFRWDIVKSTINDPAANFAAMYNLEDRTENNISATVSIKKQVSEHFLIEAAYGRGVRSANMVERYINHFSVEQDAYEYVGNPNLKAEVNNQFELAFKGKSVSEKFLSEFSYETSFYYAFFDNYIVAKVDPNLKRKYMPTTPPTNAKVFTNLDKAYKTGFEASTRFDFINDLYFKAAFAYVYAKNKDFGESLPLTPPFTSKFTFGLEKENYWINADYHLTSRQDNIAKTYGETSTAGYQTLDARAGVKWKRFTLGMACLNILDETYHNHLNFSFKNQSGLPKTAITEQGRNFTAFLQYKF